MEISNDVTVYVAAAVIAWLISKIFNEATRAFWQWKNQIAGPAMYEIGEIFKMGIAYGDQLIEKHGITDRAQVEVLVLKFVNEWMIVSGYKPFAREFAQAAIRAFVRQSKGG